MYLVFDIGGTTMRLARSGEEGTLRDVVFYDTPRTIDGALAKIVEYREARCHDAPLACAAGGVPGILDAKRRILLRSPNLQAWQGKPVQEIFSQALDMPVHLENDVALGGLGEALWGAGAPYAIVAYVSVGTGVGGVRIVNRAIDERALGFEIGHQILVPDGDVCSCGGRGHLEAYVSGEAMRRRFHKAAEEVRDAAVWKKILEQFAQGLYNTILHWSPDAVVVGGSLMKNSHLSTDSLSRRVSAFPTAYPAMPPILAGTLGDEAALYGARELIRIRSGQSS